MILICIACVSSVSEELKVQTLTQQRIGGPCEGCEAIYESPVPFDQLDGQDTLPDFAASGPKLVVSGKVFKQDGKTPAPGVVIYYYHTNQDGIYPTKGDEQGWGKRHGYLRGWIKTGKDGVYRFYTLRPGTYPSRDAPAHIHLTIKEPGINEYYIDDIQFDDDPLLTGALRKRQQNRGGDGIISTETKAGIAYGQRDIYLGKNIPDYPKNP